MMRTVATLAALVGGANAQGYTCSADFDQSICSSKGSPGIGTWTDNAPPCGCHNGFECSGTPTDNTQSCDAYASGRTACEAAGCNWTPVSSSRDCGDADAEACCLPKTCASTGWDDSACTGRWAAGGVAKSDSQCSWDGCTVTDCCALAVGQPVDCEGTWDPCDATTCLEAADRVFTSTVQAANGGRPCPTVADAVSCFDEPATDTYDGSCEDTCDANLCTGDTKLAAWATAGACTGTPTDSTQSCNGDLNGCETVAGCEWMPKPDCNGACTKADCCVPNECTVPDWTTAPDPGCKDSRCRELTLGSSGYYAANPGATTVDGLGFLGCSTGVKEVTTIAKSDDSTKFGSTGGFLGFPYNVVATCPVDGGNFVWTGCTEAADCDGAEQREVAPATCIAKGEPPSCDKVNANDPIACEVVEGGTCKATCTAVGGSCTTIGPTSTGCTYNAHDTGPEKQLETDKTACNAVTGADLADATKCEAVVTDGTHPDWQQGTCTLADGTTGPCRTYTEATCTLPDDAQPTDGVCQAPEDPCQFTGTGRGPDQCPDGCVYEPASGAACIYSPEVKSDILDMQNLGDHVVDTTGDTSCAAKDPQGKLTHWESCKVTCEDGWHLQESKRDKYKNRIMNPAYWRPLHPICDDGVMHYNVTCVEDTDWLGVLIIVAVLGFFLVLIPVVKYMRVVSSFNQDKAAGCTWAPDGTKSDPTAASDEAAD